MKSSEMRDILLVLMSVAILFTSWAGYFRVLGTQTHVLSDTGTDLAQILGRTPQFPKPTLERFMSGIFQARIGKAAGDCIPFLERIIPFLTYWKSFVYEILLTILPKSWSPVLPIGEKKYLKIRGKAQLLPTPSIYTSEIVRQIKKAANYYNNIAIKWPKVRFYVYAIPSKNEMFVDTGAWPAAPPRLLRGCKHFDQFGALLSKNVAYEWFGKGRLAKQVMDFYYNTDHHLITPGMYEIYRRIHHLISARGVNISEIVQCKNWFVVPGVIFLGTYTRRSGGYAKVTDQLISCTFDLPDYTITIHGAKHIEKRNRRFEYEAGKIPKGRFFNHYGGYFGNDIGLVEYIVDKTSEKRNLLIIGDSYDNSIEPLLAAHFSRSFFVDPRHFLEEIKQSFNLNLFISQNGITDVLFIGSYPTIVLRDLDAGEDTQEGNN